MVARTFGVILVFAAALALVSCGARTPLSAGELLLCPPGGLLAGVDTPVTLTVLAPPWAEGRVRWTVVSAPPRANPMVTESGPLTARFRAATEGIYLVRASIPASEHGDYPDAAADGGDGAATCLMTVRVRARAPRPVCPTEITTRPLQSVSLTAESLGDRMIASRQWELVGAPDASARPSPAPTDQDTTQFRPDAAGDYRLLFTVTDTSGEQGECETIVHARVVEALRVEMYWNPPNRGCASANPRPGCDASDVDLHLLRGSRGNWVSANDCYYANCVRSGLAWDAPGAQDDPRLDIDDVEGFGPENINLDQVGSRSYRVGVHYYDADGWGDAEVFVVVYCGSSAPAVRLGPQRLSDRGAPSQSDFWLAADVVMTATGCDVRPIRRPDGQPWVVAQTDAQRGEGPPPP